VETNGRVAGAHTDLVGMVKPARHLLHAIPAVSHAACLKLRWRPRER
jgi:hypothetical protein